MGVKDFLILVNKMDTIYFDKSREIFVSIQKEMTALIKKIGINLARVQFIPVSIVPHHENKDLRCQNLFKRSSYTKDILMPWFTNQYVEDALCNIEIPIRPVDKPLRILTTGACKV
jgi:elongation factor 1-alpha